jgi:hypothetical protein
MCSSSTEGHFETIAVNMSEPEITNDISNNLLVKQHKYQYALIQSYLPMCSTQLSMHYLSYV